jgi:hypothetical protein
MTDTFVSDSNCVLVPNADWSVTEIVAGRAVDDLPVSYPGERRSSPSKYKSIEISPAYEDDKTREEHPVTARGKVMHKAVETGDDSKPGGGRGARWSPCAGSARAKIIPPRTPPSGAKSGSR